MGIAACRGVYHHARHTPGCGGSGRTAATVRPQYGDGASSGRRKRPRLLWSGLSGSPLPERTNSPWFICTGGEVQVATSAETTTPAQWIAQSGAQERSQRLCYLLKAESLMQWLNLNVLTALNGPEAKCPPLAMAVGLVTSLPAVDNNLWQVWITARTGLTTDIADTGTDATLPFPDALLRQLPRQSGFTRCGGPA